MNHLCIVQAKQQSTKEILSICLILLYLFKNFSADYTLVKLCSLLVLLARRRCIWSADVATCSLVLCFLLPDYNKTLDIYLNSRYAFIRMKKFFKHIFILIFLFVSLDVLLKIPLLFFSFHSSIRLLAAELYNTFFFL